MKRSIFLLAALGLSGLPGLAETGPNAGSRWEAGHYTMNVSGTGMETVTYDAVYVLGPADVVPQSVFTCSERSGLAAAIFSEPQTIEEILDSTRRNYKMRVGTLATPGTQPRKDDWIYDKTSGALNTSELWQAQRLYNAAVTQKTATLSVFKLGKMEIEFAPLDDAFKYFVSACPSLGGN